MQVHAPIRLLPAELQNQIAAGEVVERPASVLKELVENSLDAQATRIQVHIRDGGQSLIKVSDNGHGIPAEQLVLALTRHATSKISSIHDLSTVGSFGFRGEALPSIASVSRFRLSSAQVDGEGMAIESIFGRISPSMPTALARGTDIEVSDLFANIPARLKFLKQPATESRKCTEILIRVALAHPDLDIELLLGDRTSFHFFSGQSTIQRLQDVWPPQLLEDMTPVDMALGPLRVSGVVGAPAKAQARADRIYLYVNKRPVHDKTMLSAVREAYRGRILGREYPQAVLFLDIPADEIDVNVHPAKIEVRFQDESHVFQAVRRAVSTALESTLPHAISPAHVSQITATTQTTLPLPTTDTSYRTETSPERVEAMTSSSLAQSLCGEEPSTYNPPLADPEDRLPLAQPQKSHQPSLLAVPHDATSTASPCEFQTSTYLGQVADTYLVLAESNGLTLVDQHAAHERVLYALFSQNGNSRERHPLLVPLEIPVHPTQAEEVHELWATLQDLGFSLHLDGQRLLVHAVPSLLSGGKAKEFLEDLLNAKDRTLHDLWAMLACKASIKAGTTLAPQEALALIEAWRTLPDRQFCPHGRPVAITWTAKDLEKLFKRRP